MAAESGEAPDDLSWLEQQGDDLRRYSFFALVRALEARADKRARVGRSAAAAENIVDLAHTPHLAFPGSTLDTVETRNGRPTLRSFFMGLTGPMGPMPLHVTELALQETRRRADRRPLGRFLDMLTGRMLQFFYRAWADSQPVCQADRPEDDRFRTYVELLSGAGESPGPAQAFAPLERLHYAGVFASRRSPLALSRGLGALLGAPVEIVEFSGGWFPIDEGDHSRIGRREGANNGLGAGVTLGGRVRLPEAAFTVAVTARDRDQYRALLPGGALHGRLMEAVEAWKPSHLAWEAVLRIDERALGRPGEPDAAVVELGRGARLGWTAWVAPKGDARLRDDARLRPGRNSGEMVAA